MHPYIILLLLPLIGIVVFWLLPLYQAIFAYIIILIASGLLYWVIARAMKKRSKSGLEGLVGAEAMVISKLGPHDEAQYMVRVRGELWRANSNDELKPDETVKILSVSGLTLLVKKNSVETPSSQAKTPEKHPG
jgi:membrane protein implicated in regulation of membrane protease activity